MKEYFNELRLCFNIGHTSRNKKGNMFPYSVTRNL